MSEFKPLEKAVRPDTIVDASNIFSPLPLLRLKKEIAKMKKEEVLQINCTDISSVDDIISWCMRMKHEYLGEVKDAGFSSYYVMKK